MCTYFLPRWLNKIQSVRLTDGFFEDEGIIPCLYVVIHGVHEVGYIVWVLLGSIFMVDHLICKLFCFCNNGLSDRYGHKCEEVNESKYLCSAISLLYFSWTVLLCLNTEIQRFTSYGIRREYSESTLCSSPLGEAIVSVYRLILKSSCTLLEWLTLWLCPRWWSPSTVEGIIISDITSIHCTYIGSSFIPLGAAWVSDPVCSFWGPGLSESSCKASLGMGMLEVLLICHSFARVEFYWVASYEWSSTRFFQFYVTVPLLIFSKVYNVSSKTTWYWGGHVQIRCLILGPLILNGIGGVQDRLWSSPFVPICYPFHPSLQWWF